MPELCDWAHCSRASLLAIVFKSSGSPFSVLTIKATFSPSTVGLFTRICSFLRRCKLWDVTGEFDIQPNQHLQTKWYFYGLIGFETSKKRISSQEIQSQLYILRMFSLKTMSQKAGWLINNCKSKGWKNKLSQISFSLYLFCTLSLSCKQAFVLEDEDFVINYPAVKTWLTWRQVPRAQIGAREGRLECVKSSRWKSLSKAPYSWQGDLRRIEGQRVCLNEAVKGLPTTTDLIHESPLAPGITNKITLIQKLGFRPLLSGDNMLNCSLTLQNGHRYTLTFENKRAGVGKWRPLQVAKARPRFH